MEYCQMKQTLGRQSRCIHALEGIHAIESSCGTALFGTDWPRRESATHRIATAAASGTLGKSRARRGRYHLPFRKRRSLALRDLGQAARESQA